jgi:hypothetical protein
MAAPTNTFVTTNSIGNRESLHDIITILNKDDTPFQSMIDSGDAAATFEEWQIDSLGSANATNFQPEGNTVVAQAVTPTVRVGNRLQILNKPYTISRTEQSIRKAGRDSEISYQTALAGRRVKMDLEAFISQNQASTGSDPRKLGGFESWLTSNTSRGVTGTNGGFVTSNTVAATDSSLTRGATLALLKTVLKSAWDNGGKPSWLIMSSAQKMAFSTFTGVATLFTDAGKPTVLTGTIDRFRSDFGIFNAAMSRFVRGREIMVVDPSLWGILWLDKWKKQELAQVGDARAFQIVGEMTLQCKNEAGSGIVADLA